MRVNLTRVANNNRTEIRLIHEFSVETDERLARQNPIKPKTPFSKKERDELKRVIEMLEAATSDDNPTNKPRNTKLSERVGNYLMQAVVPIKQRGFLAEMALGYLVSHLEAFIKDFALQILVNKPQLLRSSSTLTYEEATSFKSMRALRNALAEHEVESIGYGNIDDVAAYFQKKFSIVLTNFPLWEQLREHVFRRNLVVHNQGHINETYRRKMRYTGPRKRLHTDMEYVSTASMTILAFIDFVHAACTEKFCTSPKRLPKVPEKS